MTAPLPPDGPDALDPDDDAVLAVLDDTASPEQRRRVARDPALRDRLADQRAARAAVAAPVPPVAESTLAELRARALDTALGSPDAAQEDPADPSPDEVPDEPGAVVPLAPRRPRRPSRRLPAWPAVAAVVILLVGVGLALIVNDRNRDTAAELATADEARTEDEARAEEQARDLGAEAQDRPSDAGSAEDNAAATVPSTAEGALPRFADEAALRRELEAVDPRTLQPPGAADAADGRLDRAPDATALCDQGLRSVEPALEAVQASRLVMVDDQEVLVMSNPVSATPEAPASTRLTVFEPTSCTPLFAVQR